MIIEPRWRVMATIGFGGALLAIACGDDAAAPQVGSSVVPDASADVVVDAEPGANGVDAFCNQTLGLYAPRYEACCDSSVAPKQYAFDHTVTLAVGEMCKTTLGKSVASGRAVFVADAAATCSANVSAAVGARTCPDVLRSPKNQPRRSTFEGEGCEGVLVGRQTEGAACANDYECVDGLTCIGWTTTGDGVCKPPPGEGALCGYALPDAGGFIELVHWGFGEHPRCAAGFYCASAALQQGNCRPKAAANGSCNSNDQCVDGLRCQEGTCSTAGPNPADGPCERNQDCEDGLYCKRSGGSGLCKTREVAGASCSNELGSECRGACVKPDGGGASSCIAYCGSL